MQFNWKAFLTILFITPLVAIMFAFIIAFLLENTIKQRVITEVNKELTVPVKVGGKISLSFLRHFPNAALQFDQVSIANKLKSDDSDLAAVRELSFLFSIPDLMKGNIVIQKIFLQSGSMFILKDKYGQSNLEILKPASEKKKGVNLSIRQIVLQNISMKYADEINGLKAKVRIRKFSIKGDFSLPSYSLLATGDMFLETVEQGTESFAANKQISTLLAMNIKRHGKQIDIKNSEVSIEKNPFKLSGTVVSERQKTQLNITAASEGKDMSNFIALLPINLRNKLNDFEGEGAYAIEATINGSITKNTSPSVKINATLKDGNIKLSKLGRELKNVFVNIQYGIDEQGDDYLRISDFRSRISSDPFNFNMLLKHLANPSFIFSANGVFHLKELEAFVPDSLIKNFSGSIQFDNVALHGEVSNLKDYTSMSLNGSGRFTLNDIGFTAKTIRYEKMNGLLNYSGEKLDVKDLTASFLNTDVLFNGSINHLAKYVAALVERKPMDDIALEAEGSLHIKSLALAEMISTFSSLEKQSKVAERKKVDVRDIFRMNGNLNVKVDKFSYKKMQFDDVKVNLTLSPLHLRLNSFSTNTMGGNVSGNGYLVFTGTKDLLMNIGTEINDLDVSQVFLQAENFGQQTLTEKHLQGTLNAKIYLKNIWKNYTAPDLDNLNAIVDFELKNGALKNFEPVKAASAFINVNELSNIKFSDIKNRLVIYDKTVTIPAFEIKSNALNLMFSGQHGFDNMVDYRFKINLRKLLASKFNRKGKEQFIESDPYEGLNIYLSMTGNLSNPKIQYDKASAASKIRDDFKNEKEVLKTLFKKNQGNEKDDKREEKFYQINEEPVFMDFDDN